jgi:hypothetical protein
MIDFKAFQDLFSFSKVLNTPKMHWFNFLAWNMAHAM